MTFSGITEGAYATPAYLNSKFSSLISAAAPWHSVQQYGATGDGATDDAPAFTAAITAAGVYGASVFIPTPTVGYLLSSTITLLPNTWMIGESKRSTRLIHGHNGTMMALYNGASLERLYLDGNGSTYTGIGLAILNGEGKQTVRSCRMDNWQTYCVDYQSETAGSQSLFEDCELSQLTGTAIGQEAIVMRGSLTATACPRTFLGVQTQGKRFANFGPCNNVYINASRPGDFSYQTVSRGVVISSCRLGGSSIITIEGANHVISGCDIGPQVSLGTTCVNVTVRGNTYNTLPIVDTAYSATNIVETQKDVVDATGAFIAFSASSAIPTVGQGRYFQTANASPTTITDFSNGVNTQRITVRLDVNTGIANNSSLIRLKDAKNVVAGWHTANDMIGFVRLSDIWFEEFRSFPETSSISSKIAAFLVQGSSSSFTIVTWAAARPGDQIQVTIQPDAAVSSLSSGLVLHSHCTQQGQVELRVSNCSTLVQNQSSKTYFFTRNSPF